MSYSNRILKDNPVGFWKIENSGPTEDSSNGYWNGSSMTLNSSTNTSVTTADIPPLVTGGTSAAKMTSSSSIVITNNYKMFYRGTEKKSFSIDFWLSFLTIPTKNMVFSIGTNQYITLTFSDNFATLSLLDSSNNTYRAMIEIDSYESQMHVAIVYEKRAMKFYINGKPSTGIFIDSDSYFKDIYTAVPNFKFGDSSVTTDFYLDTIAFYKYALTQDQIKNRLIWGLYDNNPGFYTINNNGGYLDPNENSGYAEKYLIYNTDATWKLGLMKNCIVSEGNLTSQYISDAYYYNPLNSAYTTPYNIFSSITAFTTSGSLSARVDDFHKYYNPVSQTLTAKLYFATSSAEGAYLSIDGFSFGQLIVKKTNAANTITVTGGGVTAASQTLSTGWVDMSISVSGNIMTVIINNGTPFTLTMSSNITFSNGILYAGNAYTVSSNGTITALPTGTSYGVAYISVFDDESLPSDYTQYGNFTLSFASDINRLAISQRSTWEILIPATTVSNIIGSQALIGTGSKNVSLYAKPVGGVYKKQNTNGEKLPQLTYGSTGAPMYVMIIIDTPISSFARPKARFLEISIYTSLTAYSKGRSFSISPYTSAQHSYQMRDKNYNILARSTNFGLHFEGDTDGKSETPGSASISIPASDVVRTIEFWFRIDSIGSGTSYLLEVGNNSSTTVSYTNVSSPVLTIAGFASNLAFINGVATTSKTLALGEIYHFLGVLSADIGNTTAITLNSLTTYGSQARATYGNVTLYGDAKTANFALNKYNKFLGLTVQKVSDNITATLSESTSPLKAKWSTIRGALV